MFVSHESINSNKKKFQKPNILRRKPNSLSKAPVVKAQKSEVFASTDVKSLLTTSLILDPKNNELDIEKITNYTNSKSLHPGKNFVQKLDNNVTQVQLGHNQNVQSVFIDNRIVNDNELNQNQSSINVVESLLMGEVVRQNIPILENDLLQNKEVEHQGKQKWSLDFTQDSQKIIIEHYGSQMGSIYLDQKPDVVSTMVPLAAVSSIRQKPRTIQGENYTSTVTNLAIVPSICDEPKTISCEEFNSVATIQSLSGVSSIKQEPNIKNHPTMGNVQKISIEALTHAPVRFKCDMPNCNKEFMSEQKLKKHKNSHNKDSTRVPRQTTVECPVKKIHDSGIEEPCGIIFHIREELAKHLNEDHTIEEAAYRCTECGRRFFWSSGLRAHARAHALRAGRAALACPWPGCGRVFRQPCRLREHARAHTGDKPYPCRYPNCGWSFRTASKLMRHARRHTGERRHACAACGRAFLRREHLRDHAARHNGHHAPHARRTHACTQPDCQQSFTNMSSLYMHMKKFHKKEDNDPPGVQHESENSEAQKETSENLFMVNLLEPTSSMETTQIEIDNTEEALTLTEEGHSARTHCTWPLARTEHYQHADAYVLEEDVQVEQSEGSENNIYTVRSDLFLHGNVLHNEDSEQMAEEGGALALDADLMLDAPSVHLDQEELYTDAVDESSFRVFLLSGEELA